LNNFYSGAKDTSIEDSDKVLTSFPNFKLYKGTEEDLLGFYSYKGGMAGE